MSDQKAMLTEDTRLYIPSINSGLGLVLENIDNNQAVKIKIGENEAIVKTEDVATMLSTILPPDRAGEIFGEIESKLIAKGKAMIMLEARKDIKKGEPIVATLDVTKYIDGSGNPKGIRTTSQGFIY